MRPVLLGLMLAAGLSGAAMATDTCNGEFSASALLPLPASPVVGLDLADSSPANATLANAFTSGMQSAGTQVPGSQPATVKLRLTWQVLGQGGSNPGSGGNSPGGPVNTDGSPWAGNSQTFLQGGIDRALPDMPNYDIFSPRQSAQSGLLIFRVEARDPTGNTIYWIGSAQCTLLGGDNQQLAFQLGHLIGGSIGQRLSRVAM
jgi:hypothetical protein